MSDLIRKKVDDPIQNWLANYATEAQQNWANSRQENIDHIRSSGSPGALRSAWWYLKGIPSEIQADIADHTAKYRLQGDLDSKREAAYEAEKDRALEEYLRGKNVNYSASPWLSLKSGNPK